MPTFGGQVKSAVSEPVLEHDHEGTAQGHYRGRGNDQSRTGPSGPWLREDTARGFADGTMTATRARRRGPVGYRRSDARIHEDVCEALSDHGDLDASDIEVRVEGGEVVLRGTVSARHAKFYAEDLAAACRGVVDVINELRVARPGQGAPRG
ncbi:MAG: BON domain-containing protein, partial [Oxalobacteraceae bacterium]